jgi:hypothetical protein
MRVTGAIVFAAVLGSFQTTVTAVAAPVVDLGYAKYEGIVDGSRTQFLGIRYAESPAGKVSPEWYMIGVADKWFYRKQSLESSTKANSRLFHSEGEHSALNLLLRWSRN